MDGTVRPGCVARVINAFDPDVVAVQEVDAHRVSSGSQDQAHLIARHLRMEHVFQTMPDKEDEGYGLKRKFSTEELLNQGEHHERT